MGYFKWIDEKTRTNPILEVLVDQISHDPDVPRKYCSTSDLLNDIQKALDGKKIAWPEENKVRITPDEWMKRMRTDPIFYLHHAKGPYEMKDYEAVLLRLAANILGRSLKLIPILEEDPELTIEPSFKTNSARQYCIAYCNRLHIHNFFFSVFQKLKTDQEYS